MRSSGPMWMFALGAFALFAFGAFLLYAGYGRVQSVNSALDSLNRVDALVDSVEPDGDLNLKYNIDQKAYATRRSVPIDFPKIRAGDQVKLVYDPAHPDTPTLRQWSVVYQDSLVLGGFGLAGVFLGIVAFVAMGIMGESGAAAAPQPSVTVVSLDSPIELRTARKDLYTSLLVCAVTLGVAYLLYRNPDALWMRWISYSAAVLALLLGIGMMVAAFLDQTTKIRANQDGVEVEDSLGSRKFEWREVVALKRETVTRTRQAGLDDGTYGDAPTVMGRYLILLGGESKELLKLNEDVALEPFEDWVRLRAYIPQRTGLVVSEETVKSLF